MVQQVRDTQFGRFPIQEPMENLGLIHVRDVAKPLKVSDFEPAVTVLDQEDFAKQGIDVRTFIPGAVKVDALGSCTAQTAMESLSNILSPAEFLTLVNQLGKQTTSGLVVKNAVAVERAAIGFYHGCTDLTGDPSQEWPPTDCGSTGAFVVKYMAALGLKLKHHIASGADSVVSLMQNGAGMLGTNWLNDWMDPSSKNDYCLDGDGKLSTVQAQINRGVAGGHEITLSAVEKLTILATGHVDPFNTIIRIRNHWDSSWADHGSCRIHLSTLTSGPLAQYADIRQVMPA